MEGGVTEGIDFQLGDSNNASKISGKVLNESGAPLTNILVSTNFSNSYYPIEQTRTDSNGNYHFYLLNPGYYLVRLSDETGSYYSQYYYDTQFSSLAKPLHVITVSVFSDINAVLTPTASISGTVTLFNGVKPDSAYIELYRAIGNSWERVEYQSGYNLPNPNALGFRFRGLDPGIYRIGATHGYLSEMEFYNKKPTLESATNITITSNSNISNINFVLGQDLANATIAGQVTFSNGLPDNLRIELYRVNSIFDPKNVFVFLRPDAGGKFKIAGLDEGQYRVVMRYSSNNGSTITRIYWPAAEALEQASIITLANDTSANDVNFAVFQIYLPIISNESVRGK